MARRLAGRGGETLGIDWGTEEFGILSRYGYLNDDQKGFPRGERGRGGFSPYPDRCNISHILPANSGVSINVLPREFSKERGSRVSIARVNFQIQLHPVADAVVLQGQLILERPLALPLQHDLVRLSPNPCSYLGFE